MCEVHTTHATPFKSDEICKLLSCAQSQALINLFQEQSIQVNPDLHDRDFVLHWPHAHFYGE